MLCVYVVLNYTLVGCPCDVFNFLVTNGSSCTTVQCQRLFMSGYRLPLFSNPINKLNLFTCRATLGKKFRWVYYDVILFPPFLV